MADLFCFQDLAAVVRGLQAENDQLREELRANDRKLQAENEQLRDEVEKLRQIVVRITDSGEGGFHFVLKRFEPNKGKIIISVMKNACMIATIFSIVYENICNNLFRNGAKST